MYENQSAIIRKIYALRHTVYRATPAGREARIEFMRLALKYGLADAIRHHDLWDRGYQGLGERQFDTCFEMGDADEVGVAVLKAAREEGFLPEMQRLFSVSSMEHWANKLDAQMALF